MTRRTGSLLLAVGILCCTCVWAQTDTGTSDNPVPTQPGPKPAFTYPDTTPSLDFLSGSLENSSITLGVAAGFSFSSNGYPNTSTTQNRWLYSVTPSVRIQQFLPRVAWHLSYAGGLQRWNQIGGPSNGNQNLFSQRAGAGFLWQLAPHWQLQGDDNFSYSADPFESFLTTPGTPTANNPNPVVYYPLSNYTQNAGILTLSDRLSKTDTLAFTGTANLRDTSNYNLLTVPFYNLVSYGGRMAYTHALSPRLSLGGGYDFNSLDFGHGQQRSGIQTISLTCDYLIRRNMTISGWIGPEYTSTKTVIGIPIFGQIFYITNYNTQWSTAGGANFGWQGVRNSVRAGFARQVMDGGGPIATSQVNNFNVTYRHGFTSKLSGSVGFQYLYDVSITTSTRHYTNYYINAGASYQISTSFVANAYYARVHQNNALTAQPSIYNANLVGVTVSYNWSHPLGR